MRTTNRLEIHFHQQDEASVYLENTESGDEEKHTEILLFCLYALRQLANLGSDQTAYSLANVLLMTEAVITELAAGHESGDVRLIKYAGTPGRKRFLASLKTDGIGVQFVCNGKGFGLLSRGVGYYSPTSVVVLLRYLAMKRADDGEYLATVARAAAMCGDAHLSGQLTMGNQLQIATMISVASGEEPDAVGGELPTAGGAPAESVSVEEDDVFETLSIEELKQHLKEEMGLTEDQLEELSADDLELWREQLNEEMRLTEDD